MRVSERSSYTRTDSTRFSNEDENEMHHQQLKKEASNEHKELNAQQRNDEERRNVYGV